MEREEGVKGCTKDMANLARRPGQDPVLDHLLSVNTD